MNLISERREASHRYSALHLLGIMTGISASLGILRYAAQVDSFWFTILGLELLALTIAAFGGYLVNGRDGAAVSVMMTFFASAVLLTCYLMI